MCVCAQVNNGTGTHPIVPKGAHCASTLRAACKPDSPQRRGALNYGVVRSAGSGVDTKQLLAQPCEATCVPRQLHLSTPLCLMSRGLIYQLPAAGSTQLCSICARALRAAAQQRFRQPDGNGGELQHVASGDCVTVSGHLQDLDLAPCGMGLRDGSQNFSFSEVNMT